MIAVSSSSDSHSPPGQHTSEVPHQLKYDSTVTFLWAGFMLLFPPLWAEGDKPLHRRFWAWRYIYLLFFGVTAIVFHEPLLTGNLTFLAAFPLAHILAPLSVAGLFTGFQLPGLSLPWLDYSLSAFLYMVGVGITLTGEALRRTSPEMFARNPWGHDDGESVVPLENVAHKDDDASTPPILNQDVSTAVIGETGSGKSSMMQLLAYQFPYDRDTAVIAHDPGSEFRQFYEDLGFDVKRVGATDSDVTWNLFIDADSEEDFREVARAIFGEPDGHNPFHTPAKQTFEDMLMYLHLDAKRNNRREALCHADIVDLLHEGHYALKDALDEFDRLDSGQIDPDRGKGATNVFQTLRENVRPVFVGDFADYGEFSLEEYINNPEGRVLVIDSTPTRMETVGPMFQLLLDWSIRYAMNSPNPTVHVLDEVDALPSLNQIHNLTARGRKNKARALVGVQTIGQLEDTYSTISGILGNCPQGVYFGPGDTESTDFILDELGERRQFDRTDMVSMSQQGRHQPARVQSRETYKEQDKIPITSGVLRSFQPGECIVVSRTTWWHGQSYELHKIRESLPEMGAESPTTPHQPDEGTGSDLEDHDSWLSLARAKLNRVTGEGDTDTDEGSSDAQEGKTESDQSPLVWATDDGSTPSQSFTGDRWDQALHRLEVDEPPIEQKQHVDAMCDLCAMLDDRVLTLPDSMVETEIRDLLTDIVTLTGLTHEQTLSVVDDQTDHLQWSEEFEDQFLLDRPIGNPLDFGSGADPLDQGNDHVNVATPADDTFASQSAENQSYDDDKGADGESDEVEYLFGEADENSSDEQSPTEREALTDQQTTEDSTTESTAETDSESSETTGENDAEYDPTDFM